MTKIIRKGTAISFHKNWRQVAKDYGWNYRNSKNAMKKHGHFNGYTCEDMQLGVSIPCQKLRFAMEFGFKNSNDFKDGEDGCQEVEFIIGEHSEYMIRALVDCHTIIADVATDAAGYDHQVDDGSIEIIEIIDVFDAEGDEMPIDAETEKLILNNLQI